MRLTLSDALGPVADTLNLNTVPGTKAISYINRAQEELLNMGRWVGTTIKYRICTAEGFVTWPREIQTIEAMQINGAGTTLQNQWYQFLDYGPEFGRCGGWANGYQLWVDRGFGVDQAEAISFAEVCPRGNPKKLKVYGTAVEDVNARILLQFYDGAGNYVRTNDTVEGWQDGEFVAINSTTPQTTINAVTSWVGVQKPITNGVVRITELDTVTGLERLLAVYQPSETNPSYRRTFITGFCPQPACVKSIVIIGSQRYIPAVKLRDYLCISSLPAIIYKAKAVYMADNNNGQLATYFDGKAFDAIDKQLEAWVGSGDVQTPRFNPQNQAVTGVQSYI